MKTNTSSPITNGILMMAVAAGFAFIGGLITDWLFYIGLVLGGLFVVLWALSYKFNLFMEAKIKVFTFIKFDFKNDPKHYLALVLIWCIVLFWLFKDLFDYREIGTDVFLGLFSVYLVSCVMILWGYFKDYDKLP
jgi:Ca2+/Na+ antiporter